MTTWPETLPQSPLIDGFRESAPDNTLRTDMEQGPAKIRRRTTAAPRKMTLGFLLSKTQVETLEDFYAETLSGGCLPFGFSHPRTGDTLNCRFRRPPEYAGANGDYFRVMIELEALP